MEVCLGYYFASQDAIGCDEDHHDDTTADTLRAEIDVAVPP